MSRLSLTMPRCPTIGTSFSGRPATATYRHSCSNSPTRTSSAGRNTVTLLGHGHLYQGRYKCFPVQGDDHFYDVVRYVERNPLRANLVSAAELWPWSSLARTAQPRPPFSILADWPLPRPTNWIAIVNQPQSEAELAALRKCAHRGRPFGDTTWTDATARSLGIESTLRARGRPRQRL
jgi:putative transposase